MALLIQSLQDLLRRPISDDDGLELDLKGLHSLPVLRVQLLPKASALLKTSNNSAPRKYTNQHLNQRHGILKTHVNFEQG